jgi:hypothetical protein
VGFGVWGIGFRVGIWGVGFGVSGGDLRDFLAAGDL